MKFLEIDGSFGEGGGQIVRTAITLSCIMKQPIKIENIRKKRKNPGLKPQHLTALKILKKICNADLDQLKIGSTSLEFIPGDMQSLNLKENVGTAGSISLIIQVLIPVIAICKKKIKTYNYRWNKCALESHHRLYSNCFKRSIYPNGN